MTSPPAVVVYPRNILRASERKEGLDGQGRWHTEIIRCVCIVGRGREGVQSNSSVIIKEKTGMGPKDQNM